MALGIKSIEPLLFTPEMEGAFSRKSALETFRLRCRSYEECSGDGVSRGEGLGFYRVWYRYSDEKSPCWDRGHAAGFWR